MIYHFESHQHTQLVEEETNHLIRSVLLKAEITVEQLNQWEKIRKKVVKISRCLTKKIFKTLIDGSFRSQTVAIHLHAQV